MKYFKKDGEVFAFEDDGSQDHLIAKDFTKMTSNEIDRHINPRKYMTEEEKYQHTVSMLQPLSRKQFRRMLVLNDFDIDEIRESILNINDSKLKMLTLIYWDDSDTFYRTDEYLSIIDIDKYRLNDMWKEALSY